MSATIYPYHVVNTATGALADSLKTYEAAKRLADDLRKLRAADYDVVHNGSVVYGTWQ